MARSPISILQEFVVKQGYIPTYDFFIHNNYFGCKVTCGDLSIDGEGKSKKEAKVNAATNMLLMLTKNTSLHTTNNSLSTIAQSGKSTESYGTVSSVTQSNQAIKDINNEQNICENIYEYKSICTFINYVGQLQEYCVQQYNTTGNISYNVIDESGPPHMKIFIIEACFGSSQAQGSGQTKKTAKQEAARNLLQLLKKESYPRQVQATNVNCANTLNQEKLEYQIQKLGVAISECTISKPLLKEADILKKAKSLYLQTTSTNTSKFYSKGLIKDSHALFEETYSSRISSSLREKLQVIHNKRDKSMIKENSYSIIREVKQDIENEFGGKVQLFDIPSKQAYVIGLRLLSKPNITQLGMGVTKTEAETRAMYNLIVVILTLLN
ncbi:double-stranded RNA-binding protein Staufen homolog [Pseudomyrmex gracilis]|uniref:double-stranded RNA-binding protein Staufen homolog n=1 Tax=Pseudomyrmex gracilis TaxID=219809 RepID=UPI00099541DA|nr:double-stranded RNA-binding protein Staufen homolog [Pseudomyrmex gracilis]XP_020298320.1 double-stranded RNA-binding protein Staufen homolog [Pseudomyrmex gracilis]